MEAEVSAFRVCMLLLLFGTWQTNGRRERGRSVVHLTGKVLLSLHRPHADSLEQTIQHLYLYTLCVFAELDLIILNCALHGLVVKYSQYGLQLRTDLSRQTNHANAIVVAT